MTELATTTVLRENLRKVIRHKNALTKSLLRLKPILDVTQLRDDSLQESWDAFRARFQDLQDALHARLFRGVLVFRGEPYHSHQDMLATFARWQLLDPVEWSELRSLRNEFAHDYPEDMDAIKDTLNEALRMSPKLLAVTQRFENFLHKHGIHP